MKYFFFLFEDRKNSSSFPLFLPLYYGKKGLALFPRYSAFYPYSPATRAVTYKPDQSARLISFPRVGGLHHRYDWQPAA
jgi:hypothetical protein